MSKKARRSAWTDKALIFHQISVQDRNPEEKEMTQKVAVRSLIYNNP